MSRPAHILIVDDDHFAVDLALDGIRGARVNCTVHAAMGGQEALDYVFGRGSYADRGRFPLPDLILCDLWMPVVSGLDVLVQVKSAPELRRIPVVVLTSSEADDDRARCYDRGANSYLIKPVARDGFRELLRRIEGYWLELNVGPPGSR